MATTARIAHYVKVYESTLDQTRNPMGWEKFLSCSILPYGNQAVLSLNLMSQIVQRKLKAFKLEMRSLKTSHDSFLMRRIAPILVRLHRFLTGSQVLFSTRRVVVVRVSLPLHGVLYFASSAALTSNGLFFVLWAPIFELQRCRCG